MFVDNANNEPVFTVCSRLGPSNPVASRWGAVLVSHVPPTLLGRLLAGDAFRRSEAAFGGVWVGAKLVVDEDALHVRPLFWERWLQHGPSDVALSLVAVRKIAEITTDPVGALRIYYPSGELIFRCRRALAFGEAIGRQRERFIAARGPAGPA